MNSKWVVTGGLGYIGSHVVSKLISLNYEVIVIDATQDKSRKIVSPIVTYFEVDILDANSLKKTLDRYEITGIIHMAALKSVSESLEFPEKYHRVNVLGTKNLLELAAANGIKNFIFASSAAVYGDLPNSIAKESEKTLPISPYGKSKLDAESLIDSFCSENNICHVSIRFFNVAGTSSKQLEDRSKSNLIPIVVDMLKQNKAPSIFGSDFPTKDGTCIRDYIHVEDIANFHALLVDKISICELPKVLNLGSGTGNSVLEVIHEIVSQMKCTISPILKPRRTGDPAALVADMSITRSVTGFENKCDIKSIISSLI